METGLVVMFLENINSFLTLVEHRGSGRRTLQGDASDFAGSRENLYPSR